MIEGTKDRPEVNHKIASVEDRLDTLDTQITVLPIDGQLLDFGWCKAKVFYKTGIDLDASLTQQITHGLTYAKIIGLYTGWVENDAGTTKYSIANGTASGAGDVSSLTEFDDLHIHLAFGSSFNAATFDNCKIFLIVLYFD